MQAQDRCHLGLLAHPAAAAAAVLPPALPLVFKTFKTQTLNHVLSTSGNSCVGV
jgi:hypothetical protein